MPLKAVLFDMDGVIVDTEPLHRKAYYKTFENLNIRVPEELYASFTGNSTQKVCETLVSHFQLPQSWQEIAGIKRKYFKEYFDTDPEFCLIPGVLDLIKSYHAHHIKLVLASSAHLNTINWVFEKFDLNPYFSGKISGAALRESKPHPEIFLLAAEISGEEKADCMVIEDSTNGILAAHRAGIFCAGFRSPHSALQNYDLADIVVENFSELMPEKLDSFFKAG